MTNGEKFKSAEERYVEFKKFCHKYDCGHCPVNEDGIMEAKCGFKWLNLEYKKEEPKPCPFCGCEKISTLVLHGDERKLRCTECGAQTAVFIDRDAMIDSWNRRV